MKKAFVTFFFLVSALMVHAQGYISDDPAYIKNADRATEALNRGNWDSCAYYFEAAFQINDLSAWSRFRCGKCLILSGNPGKSIPHLLFALQNNFERYAQFWEADTLLDPYRNIPELGPVQHHLSREWDRYWEDRDRELFVELKEMRDRDQYWRMKWAESKAKDPIPGIADSVAAVDQRNTERMMQILQEKGWPRLSQVGSGGATYAWLLAQHADQNPLFQRICLDSMEVLLKDEEVHLYTYAYLADRVRVNSGRMQLFGTQAFKKHPSEAHQFRPIESEVEINTRREEYQLPSLQYYAEQMNITYAEDSITVPECEKRKIRREGQSKNLRTAIREALEREEWDILPNLYKSLFETGTMTGEELESALITWMTIIPKSGSETIFNTFLWALAVRGKGKFIRTHAQKLERLPAYQEIRKMEKIFPGAI